MDKKIFKRWIPSDGKPPTMNMVIETKLEMNVEDMINTGYPTLDRKVYNDNHQRRWLGLWKVRAE